MKRIYPLYPLIKKFKKSLKKSFKKSEMHCGALCDYTTPAYSAIIALWVSRDNMKLNIINNL